MSFFISPNNGLFVEAWTAWHLPFPGNQAFKSKAEYAGYRDALRVALTSLPQLGTLYARYTFDGRANHDPDVENVLFYNIGCDAFEANAVTSLYFEREDGPVPIRKGLEFVPRAYVKYATANADRCVRFGASDAIATCSPVVCADPRYISNCARLWRIFKPAIVSKAEPGAHRSKPFAMQMRISAPSSIRLNLAKIAKPLLDGFISALHYYEGKHFDAVVTRTAKKLSDSPEMIGDLLTERQGAVLGPRSVPHLRGDGLQWSPADDFLIAGEIVREFLPEGEPISLSGYVSPAPSRYAAK